MFRSTSRISRHRLQHCDVIGERCGNSGSRYGGLARCYACSSLALTADDSQHGITGTNNALAQTTPQDAARQLPQRSPIHTVAANDGADLANVERNIEQLKANQQQIARDSSKPLRSSRRAGRDKTRAREGFEQNPPRRHRLRRSRLRPCASRADAQSPHARAGLESKGVDYEDGSRRCVIIEVLSCNNL